MTHPRVKQVLGRMPGTAEAYQSLLANGSQPEGGYRLDRLEDALPAWAAAGIAGSSRLLDRKVLVFGYLPWWVEHSSALAVVLAALGCKVGLGFIPYRKWTESVDIFDRRRQSAYVRSVLSSGRELFSVHDLSNFGRRQLSEDLTSQLAALSRTDVQYTLQREDAGDQSESNLYKLRLERNLATARSTLALLDANEYQVIVVPNGSILEFGAVYLAAQSLGTTVVTYEFGEQRDRMWVAQDSEVMRQDTAEIWQARGGLDLFESERSELEAMFEARRSGSQWARFARQWQSAPSRGAESAAAQLDLDLERPTALLCTNVIGDSLALNRQLFTTGMAEWLTVTAKHFNSLDDAQLIVRVHPGEMLGAGHPSTDILRTALPVMPDRVKLVGPDSDINTYDLIELADVGLVYTSTVGLEMAMAGIPVIVAGDTHYRGKGFTSDPASEQEYFKAINRVLESEAELDEAQRELAVRYAYRFFFEYPFSFPWHLIGFWQDIEARPVEDVIASPEVYMDTLRALVGEPIDWTMKHG